MDSSKSMRPQFNMRNHWEMCQKDCKDTEFCCVFAMKAGRWHSRWSYQALFTFNPYIRRWISLTVFLKWMETGKNIHQQYLIASSCPISTPKIVGKNCGHEPANTKTWFSSFLAQQVFDVTRNTDHTTVPVDLSTTRIISNFPHRYPRYFCMAPSNKNGKNGNPAAKTSATRLWFESDCSAVKILIWYKGHKSNVKIQQKPLVKFQWVCCCFFWLQRGFSSSNFQCVSTKFLISKWVDRTHLF